MNKRLYLASPLGFSEAGRFFMYERLIPLVERCGFEVIDPWNLTSVELINGAISMEPGREKNRAWEEVNMVIGKNNTAAIETCDGIIALLDGSDVDSGTASEIGYGTALGKSVAGYRSDFRKAGDNEGSMVNLQVEYFIKASGGSVASSLGELEDLIMKTFT